MSAAAQQFVDTFDFAGARRFIAERVLQVRREVRSYAIAIGVLVVAGGVQHVLRHAGAIGAFDRTDGAFAVLLLFMCAFAARRLLVLRQLPDRCADGPALRRLQQRESGRVMRERTLASAATLLALAALVLLVVDSILDGAWVFAAAFALLAVGAGSALRLYCGARARRRAERYVAGEIGSADYSTGGEPGDKGGSSRS